MTNKKSLRNFLWVGLVAVTTALIVFSHLPAKAQAQTAKHYTELEFPPLAEVKLPQYDRYQLDNGMVVYLIEDRKLPLVTGNAVIRTGSRLEPSEQVGLAEITGTTMRTGGTKQHSPDELNEILEQRAATIEAQIDTSVGNASFNTLSEDLDAVFKLFAQVIREPAFAPDKIELAKIQKRGNIARRNDNPGDIASREFRKLIYGQSSPYARSTEYETLENFSRQDVVNFYQKYVRPDQIILGIVGDFEPQKMKALIEETFGDWKAPAIAPQKTVPTANQKNQSGVFFVNRPDLTQSNILLGHIGGKLSSEDYPALTVLNGVLNGFGGRLFNDIRARQGLAYTVYGLWSPRYDYPGLFVAGGQTQSSSTVPFVNSILSEIERMRTSKITSEELAYAKESILNSFVFNFEKPSQTLSRLMRYEYYGYPADFIFKYQQAVKETTIEDVQRVAQKYLQPDKIVTLVVGNSNEIQPPLSNLDDNVRAVDISIPEPRRS